MNRHAYDYIKKAKLEGRVIDAWKFEALTLLDRLQSISTEVEATRCMIDLDEPELANASLDVIEILAALPLSENLI